MPFVMDKCHVCGCRFSRYESDFALFETCPDCVRKAVKEAWKNALTKLGGKNGRIKMD